MEVPCCFGMIRAVQKAISDSGQEVPLKALKIGIKGEITDVTELVEKRQAG